MGKVLFYEVKIEAKASKVSRSGAGTVVPLALHELQAAKVMSNSRGKTAHRAKRAPSVAPKKCFGSRAALGGKKWGEGGRFPSAPNLGDRLRFFCYINKKESGSLSGTWLSQLRKLSPRERRGFDRSALARLKTALQKGIDPRGG